MPGGEVRIRAAVCLCEDDRILLVQHAKQGRRYWLLPGGGLEAGETAAAAAAREMGEETGLRVEIGPLVLVCETIEPAGRHIVHAVFAGRRAGGSLAVGTDPRVVEVTWHRRADLGRLEVRPAIAAEILACWGEGFSRSARYLGDVWGGEPTPPL